MTMLLQAIVGADQLGLMLLAVDRRGLSLYFVIQ